MKKGQFPSFTEQRFFEFTLDELFEPDSKVVQNYIRDKDVVDLADEIIKDIEYPFYLGAPDDRHDINYFRGFYCRSIVEDFWQSADETLTIKKGDCEDSSIAFVTCAFALEKNVKVAYELFGVVKDANTGAILGGHGWSVFLIDKPAGIYAIYESTLDTPPMDYPVVGKFEDVLKPFRLGNVVYVPEWVFNKEEFYLVNGVTEESYFTAMRVARKLKKKKENIEKYKVIGEAWKTRTKVEVEFNKKKSKVKRVVKKILRR